MIGLRPFFFRLRFAKNIMMLLLLCAAGCTSAAEDTMSINEIPPFSAAQPVAAQDHAEQQAAFVDALNRQWQGKYRITGQRLFVYTAPAKWVVLDKFVDNHVQDKLGGKREYDEQNFPGVSAAVVWKIGTFRTHRVAVAMADTALPDGGTLFGYFEVEKD